MKSWFGIAAALLTLAVAPSAHAIIPVVNVETHCANDAAAVTYTVTMSSYPAVAENSNVQVEISVDEGPWTVIGTGAVLFSNNHTFSGTVALPDGSLTLRARVIALGFWSNGKKNEIYEYAVATLNEAAATVYDVPQDCAPPPPPSNPGTGTPGYWKNHPEAWPVDSLVIGGRTYSQAELIDILSTPTAKDVTYTLARHLIAAELNGIIGNDITCIVVILDDAQAWFVAHPIGSGVRARDAAWSGAGSALSTELDDYNNGLLCAPHRD